MDTPLLSPITKRYTDRSTTRAFAFSFYCDKCGKEWRSTTRAFDPGELQSPTDRRVLGMLWDGQHKAAYEQANLEAIYAFSHCPECDRRICLECFCRTETDIAEICTDCLQRLGRLHS